MNETTRPDMHCRTTRATTLDTRSVFCALHSSSRRQRCIQSRVACLIQQRVNECDALHGFAQACSNSRSSAWVTEQQAKHPSLLDTSPTGWPRQMAHTTPCLMRWTCRSSWLPYGPHCSSWHALLQLLNDPLRGCDCRRQVSLWVALFARGAYPCHPPGRRLCPGCTARTASARRPTEGQHAHAWC